MTLQEILAEQNVEVVGKSDRLTLPMIDGPRQTRAIGTLAKVLNEHGPDHLRFTLMSILESRNNARALTSSVIAAVSDLVAGHPQWASQPSRWFEVFDRAPLEEFDRVTALNPPCPRRYAIQTLLFERLLPVFGEEQGRMRV